MLSKAGGPQDLCGHAVATKIPPPSSFGKLISHGVHGKVPTTLLLLSYKHSNNLYSVSQNIKLKQSRYTPWRLLGERRYSSYSFSTSVLDGDEWSVSRTSRALAPGKKGPPVPIVLEAGWASEPVWTQRLEKKSFRLCRGSNPDRPVVQPVVRHYTKLSGSPYPYICNINLSCLLHTTIIITTYIESD
jgi:hypothetical protein